MAFEPYWIFVANERLPHVGAGLRLIYVEDDGKKLRWKHKFSAKRSKPMHRRMWDAMPHILNEGQNMCTILEALRGPTAGASCPIKERRR